MVDVPLVVIPAGVAIGAIALSIFTRRQGVKNWWAYLVSVPILLYFAVAAAAGHPITGHAH